MSKQIETQPAAVPDGLHWGKYIKPYLLYFIAGPILMIVEVLGEVLMPRFLAYIIDYGVSGEAENAPAFIRWLYDLCGRMTSDSDNVPFIAAIAVAMILTAILMMIGGVGGAYFGSKASVNFAADLRADIYRKVQSFSFRNIDRFSTGSLVTRLTNDVTQLQNFVNTLLRMALRAPGMLIGALIMVISMDISKGTHMSLVLAIAVPVLAISIAIFIKMAAPRFTAVQNRVDGLNSNVQENLTNVRVVKSFVREEHEIRRFEKTNAELKKTGMSAWLLMIFMSPLMTLCMNAATLSVLWFGGRQVMAGSMSTGDLTSFITYITQVLNSLMMVSMLFIQMTRAMASARRVREVMEEVPDISDTEAAHPELTVREGSVELRHVSFRYYKDSAERVLDDINLNIPAGSTVGIIGSTGSGKSSLINLVPRFYDATQGEVLVDGVNVRDYKLKALRDKIGYVPQQSFLFKGTIASNVAYGDTDRDDDTVRRACDVAQATEFIDKKQKKYDSGISQGGSNVSGGQKQRLSIARAVYRHPEILIFDDSFSALDFKTDRAVRDALEKEAKDSTKLIVAQRIGTIMNADRIIVLDDGKVVGQGTHEELLDTCEVYRQIAESQLSEDELKR